MNPKNSTPIVLADSRGQANRVAGRQAPLFLGALLAAVQVFLLAVPACADDESPGVEPDATDAQVTVMGLTQGTLPLETRALDRINALQDTPATLEARTGGFVVEIVAQEGQEVAAGDVVLRFDTRAAEAAASKAKSDLAIAQKELDYAQASGLDEQQSELDLAADQARIQADQDTKEADRLTTLLEKNLVSDKAASEARQNAESSGRAAAAAKSKADNFRAAGRALELERLRGSVAEARSALSMAEIDLESLTVRSPVGAHVSRVYVGVGQNVEHGALVAELQANEGIGAQFALTPSRARQIRQGMTFTLHDEGDGGQWDGRIVSVGAGVDPESGLVRIQGVIDGSSDAPPFFGQVLPADIVVGSSPDGLIAPESALSVTEEGSFIHIVDADNIAHLTPVSVLAETNGKIVVTADGLEAGALAIVDGNYNLPDGARVRPAS